MNNIKIVVQNEEGIKSNVDFIYTRKLESGIYAAIGLVVMSNCSKCNINKQSGKSAMCSKVGDFGLLTVWQPNPKQHTQVLFSKEATDFGFGAMLTIFPPEWYNALQMCFKMAQMDTIQDLLNAKQDFEQ